MKKVVFQFDKGECSVEALMAVLTSTEAHDATGVKVSAFMNGDIRQITLVKPVPRTPSNIADHMSHTI